MAVSKVEKANLMREIGDVGCDLFAVVVSRFNSFRPKVTSLHIHPQRPRHVDHRLFTASSECLDFVRAFRSLFACGDLL